MKSNSLLVLACLISTPIFAQSLPDEINYAPYESRFRTLGQQVAQAEAQLSQGRTSLEETQRYISEMSAHLVTLENHIRQSEAQINENQRMIPELENQIYQSRHEQSRLGNEIRRLQGEESHYHNQYQREFRQLRPLEEVVARKEQRIQQIRRDLVQEQRAERDAMNRLNHVQNEIVTLDREIDKERSRQQGLKNDLRNFDANVAQINQAISSLESQNAQLNTQHASVSARVTQMTAEVDAVRAEIANLRTSGASAQAIRAAEQKLVAMSRSRDQQAQELVKIQNQIAANNNGIKNNQARIAEMHRTRDAIPAQIAESEARERQHVAARAQRTPNLARARDDHAQAMRNVQNIERSINIAINDLRPDENNLMRQRQIVDQIVRQIEAIKAEISQLSARHQVIDREVAQTDGRIRELTNQIPQLQNAIKQAQSEITKSRRELTIAQNDERKLQQEISTQEAKLSQLQSDRSRAEGEMNQRVSLYNRYYYEAQELGAGQADTGLSLGEKEGSRLATVLARQNGKAVGSELGLAEAKHWGYVRGEIQGYETGYSDGLASNEDRSRGQIEGNNRGRNDAQVFAQANFRPVFFEELLQEEFKRPLPQKNMAVSLNIKGLKNFNELQSTETVASINETIDPLTSAEIQRSSQIITAVDDSINNFAKEVKAIEAKSVRMGDASVAYEVPAKIPFGTASCTQVYKALAVFKSACESSYKGAFSQNYLNSTQAAFTSSYGSQYMTELSDAQIISREGNYPTQYAVAAKVARAQGLKTGKEEIYQQTFAVNYRQSYDQELPLAREKAKYDAGTELAQFLKTKPALTLSESRLAASEEFRGGEVVDVLGKVKNISKVALKGPAVIRITSVQNAEILVKEAVLNHAAAGSFTDMPALKIRVSSSARAGQKVVVKGIVELPGDVYRSQRQESFELVQTLVANPAHNVGLKFDNTPSIKGVFRRNIHFLSATIAPTLEDISAGYKVTLTAVGENAGQIELRETSFDTGALKQGQEKELRYSYVFPDSAKNKVITLELAVTYGNKVIKTEKLELRPH